MILTNKESKRLEHGRIFAPGLQDNERIYQFLKNSLPKDKALEYSRQEVESILEIDANVITCVENSAKDLVGITISYPAILIPSIAEKEKWSQQGGFDPKYFNKGAIYNELRKNAVRQNSQLIIATHSEVILDDAVDTNLTLLLNGEAVNLATQQDMKNSLRSYGIEHYYKAKVHPRILYVEGSTDIAMLSELARKLNHPAEKIFEDELYCYYTQNVEAECSLNNSLDSAGGAYGNFRSHFYALKRFVSELKGIAIFDGDNKTRDETTENDLAIRYWRNYELENYFITPELLCKYAVKQFNEKNEPLFNESLSQSFCEIVDNCLLDDFFSGNKDQLEEFKKASVGIKRRILENTKMSLFAEKVFTKFAEKVKQPVLLNKGDFYRMIELVNPSDIPEEIKEKLDLINKYLALPIR